MTLAQVAGQQTLKTLTVPYNLFEISGRPKAPDDPRIS